MQLGDLGVARILRRALSTGTGAPVACRTDNGIQFQTMQQCAARAICLGLALRDFGLRPGERVATFCTATCEHFEAHLGVPACGFVLHALNIRMSDTDLSDIMAMSADKVLILDAALVDRFATLAPMLAGSGLQLILLAGESTRPVTAPPGVEVMPYAHFIADRAPPEPSRIEDIPENAPATICHTGGTTGRPKAVAYSHRSVWIQALNLCLVDTLGLCQADNALPAVPFYHVNGWGLPYACAMIGAGLVLPGRSFRPDNLLELMDRAAVTIAAGVPTIWTDLLTHLAHQGGNLPPDLARIATGGAVVPAMLRKSLMQRGIVTLQAWGMTETSSMSVIGAVADDVLHCPIGRPVAGLELRTVDETGTALPPGSTRPGEVHVRGPMVISRYLDMDGPAAGPEGWVATGDIGMIGADGTLTLTDRLKDAVKSGGEWIPAAPLEDAICTIGWIREAAVIAQPHARFQERPFGVIVIDPAREPDMTELGTHLRSIVPGWWVPEQWSVIDALPRTALGKPDKRLLRDMLARSQLPITDGT